MIVIFLTIFRGRCIGNEIPAFYTPVINWSFNALIFDIGQGGTWSKSLYIISEMTRINGL